MARDHSAEARKSFIEAVRHIWHSNTRVASFFRLSLIANWVLVSIAYVRFFQEGKIWILIPTAALTAIWIAGATVLVTMGLRQLFGASPESLYEPYGESLKLWQVLLEVLVANLVLYGAVIWIVIPVLSLILGWT